MSSGHRSMLRRHLSRDHGYTDDEVEQTFGRRRSASWPAPTPEREHQDAHTTDEVLGRRAGHSHSREG